MSTANKQSPEYYKALYAEIDKQEFYPALLYYLLHYDIANFSPMFDMPITDETKKLMDQSRDRIEKFIDDWRIYYYKSVTQLYKLYNLYCKFYYGDNTKIM